ncbi:MAG: hypothetical protein M0R37_15385 [Bacteroidales bacterium]|jgi:hypothetical protein|nr:hypothetical protein [Bacteroidales bacterium]
MTTLAQLVGQTRRMLSDFNQRGAASGTGDGVQTLWRLPDQNIIGNEVILAATDLTDEEQDISSGLVDPPLLTVVRVQGNAAGISGDVVVTGTAWDGSAATDTIALSGTSVVSGTQKFKTVTGVTLPVETHEGTDTVTVTSGTSVACTVNSVAQTAGSAWTCDYDTGWLEFVTAPTDTHEVLFGYLYTHFSLDDIRTAINLGVDRLFPYFYVNDLDTSLSTVTGTYEYTVPDCETVTGVEWRSSSTDNWMPLMRRRFELVRDGTTRYLKFRDNPSAGSLRLRLVKRAAHFTSDSDTLTDLGLPDRCQSAIIAYAALWLLDERILSRVQSDAAIANQGQGAASVYYDFYRAHNALSMLLESELNLKRMSPWSSR